MIVSVTFHFIENDEMKVNREYGCLIMLCLTSFVVHCRPKGHIWNNRNYDNCIFFFFYKQWSDLFHSNNTVFYLWTLFLTSNLISVNAFQNNPIIEMSVRPRALWLNGLDRATPPLYEVRLKHDK